MHRAKLSQPVRQKAAILRRAQPFVDAPKHLMNSWRNTATVKAQAIAEVDRVTSVTKVETPVYHVIEKQKKSNKPRAVVLGSGWGAMSFIKALPKNIRDTYDLVVISPRNYFLYTPLLPAVATGTMEERSIVEAVRQIIGPKGDFYEALCEDIDPVNKQVICCSAVETGLAKACFSVSYDVLVLSVGCISTTFGIKGVERHCNFFKSIDDANALRRRMSDCFERASFPGCPEEERKRLLSFVVVGGGPTGVEVAAEIYDMTMDDLRKIYPKLIDDVQISIVELMDNVLSTYDRAISRYTADVFNRAGIKLVLSSRVSSVQENFVTVVDKANNATDIPYGACVWATGIALHPLVKALQARIPGQNHTRCILTDEFLRVRGSNGSIFALGDAATVYQPKAMEAAEDLFVRGDLNKDKRIDFGEMKSLLRIASKEYPQLVEHAQILENSGNGFSNSNSNSPFAMLKGQKDLGYEEFRGLLAKIDSSLKALPATAQVAKQQGEYLANMFARVKFTGNPEDPIPPAKFQYFHKGSTAYVGADKAVFDVPVIGALTGYGAGVLWKSFETFSQISLRNQFLVATDWVRTKLFGRDISKV